MAEKKPVKKPAVKKSAPKKSAPKKLKVNEPKGGSEEPIPSSEPGKQIKFPGTMVRGKMERPTIKYPGMGPDADAVLNGRLTDPSVGPVQKRIPWDAPDKEMYRGQFFAPEPLTTPRNQLPGRRPESLGLPPVPKPNFDVSPLGNPESVFGSRPPVIPTDPKPVTGSKPPVSLPETRIGGGSYAPATRPASNSPEPVAKMQRGAPASEPKWNLLDKFRGGAAPAAGGAASWDPAFNPESNVPSWIKDDEASRFEERRAHNAEMEDWWLSQTPSQIGANLKEAAVKQGEPGYGKTDPVEFFRNLQRRK
jgi:hypothetical protein